MGSELVGTNRVYISQRSDISSYFLPSSAWHICENIRPLIRYFPRIWTNLRDLRRLLFCFFLWRKSLLPVIYYIWHYSCMPPLCKLSDNNSILGRCVAPCNISVQFIMKIFTHIPYNKWDKNRKRKVPRTDSVRFTQLWSVSRIVYSKP